MDGSVRVPTGLLVGRRGFLGFDSREGVGIFLFATVFRPALGPTQASPIQGIPGALSLEVKRPRREADHSPRSSVEMRNAWSYTSAPPVLPHDVVDMSS
jgi:nitrate reductase cytochrome c-type subunit